MNGNQHPSPETLVTGPSRVPGIVQVRQPVVLASVCIVTILVGLMLWLIVGRAAQITAATPDRLAARADAADLQPSTVTALHPTVLEIPKAISTATSHVDAEQTMDPNLLAATQSSAAAPPSEEVAAPTTPISQTTESPSERRHREEQEAHERATAATQAARDADLRVHLDDSSDVVATDTTQAQAGRSARATEDGPDAYDIPPVSDYIVQRGMIIPATLYTSIDSTLTGTIIGLVSMDVYDSRHRAVLIPRGAKLTGTYQSNVAQGQARLFVAWDAIKLPNDHTIPLGSMPGIDLSGSAGFGASVDHHTAQVFRSVVLLSILSAGAQLSQPQNAGNCGPYGCQSSVGQQMAGAVGQNIVQAGTQIVSRDANIMPTLHVSEGSQVAVMVESDIPLRPWSTTP